MDNKGLTKVVYIVIAALVLVAASFINACAPKAAPAPTVTVTKTVTATTIPSPPAPKILKISDIGAHSGASAAWGLPEKRANSIVAEMINDRGGIKVGGDRYIIELSQEDAHYVAPEAVALVKKHITEGIVFFIGPLGSPILLAVAPILVENNRFVTQMNRHKDVIGPNKPLFFQNGLALEYPPGVYGWALKNYDIKTAVLLSFDNTSGKASSEVARAFLEPRGVKILADDYHPVEEIEYTPLLTKYAKLKPDLIITEGALGLKLKQAAGVGLKPKVWATTTYPPIADMVGIAGKEAIEGLVFPYRDFTAPGATPETREYYDRYVKKFGTFDPGATEWVDLLWLLKQAIETAGSLDVWKVKEAAETMTPRSMTGPGKYSGKKFYGIDHQLVIGIGLGQIKDGKAVSVGSMSMEEMLKALGWD